MGAFDDLLPKRPADYAGLFDDLLPPQPETAMEPGVPADPGMGQPAPDMPQSMAPISRTLFPSMDGYQPDIPFDPRTMPGTPAAMPLPATQDAVEPQVGPPDMPMGQHMMDALYGRGIGWQQYQDAINPQTSEPAPAAGPFDGEGMGALLQRRGQQFTAGLTDFIASQPEAQSVLDARGERSQSEDAARIVGDALSMIQQIEQRYPSATPEDQARMGQVLQEQQQIIEAWSSALPPEIGGQPIPPAADRSGQETGAGIRQRAEDRFGAPDERDQSFWGQVAQGLGNAAGFVGTTVASAPLGPGAIVPGMMAGSRMNTQAVYKEAIDMGATEETALEASEWATLVGASEIVPITRAIKMLPPRLRPDVGEGFLRKFLDIAQSGGEEATQEFLATVANNMIAQGYYDPDRGTWDDAIEGASVGGVVGAILGTGGVAGQSLRNRGRSAPDAPMQPPEGMPPPQPETAPVTPQPEQTQAPQVTQPLQQPVTAPETVAQPQVEPQAPLTPQAEQQPPAQPQETALAATDAPTEQATPQPVDREDPQEPSGPQEFATEPEPELDRQRPLTHRIRQLGGIRASEVDPNTGERRPTYLAQELKSRGITPRTHPALFNNRTGLRGLDNVDPASISDDAAQIFPMAEDGRYLSQDGLIEALAGELTGAAPAYTSLAARNAVADFERAMQDFTQAQQRQPTPAPERPTADRTMMAASEFFDATDPVSAALPRVQEVAQAQGITATPDEIQRAAQSIAQREGGDILDALEAELIRSYQNQISPAAQEATPDADQPPFGDEPARPDQGVSDRDQGDTVDRGLDPGATERGAAATERVRGTRESPPTTEQTPEGEQAVIPGAEARPAGEGTQRAAQTRAQDEAKVRQQQSKMRTSTPQEGSGPLFGDGQQQLFDAPTRVGRRPKGGLSPTFLDFSFTNKQSVFDHAFRAAGLDPKTAINLPIEQQLPAVKKAVEDTFGIKVELPTRTFQAKNRFGRKVAKERTDISAREAVDQLLNAYRNLQMLAHVMAMPEKAIGLPVNGNPITLSLVATKSLRGALGMYSYTGNGENRTIILPGMSNSFAHEWAHALDHYMALQSDPKTLKGLLTETMTTKGVQPMLSPKRHLTDAFAHIIWSMYGDGSRIGALRLQLQVESAQVGADGQFTPKAKRAQKILTDMREGKMPPKEYWSQYFRNAQIFGQMNGDNGYFASPAEMFARAFEAFTAKQIEAVSDLPQAFLTKGTWAYQDSTDTRAQMTFPKGIDLDQFSLAMGALQQAMSRISLHGPNAPALAPESHDTMGTRALLKVDKRRGVVSSELQAAVENLNALRNVPATLRDTKTSFVEKTGQFYSQAIRTGAATLYVVAGRQESAKAREALTNIAKAVGKQPGKGQLTESLWEEGVRRKHGVRMNKVEGAVNKAVRGLNQRTLTPEQLRKVRGLLSGEIKSDHAALNELARDMRQILNEIWYDLKGAGVQVGYASNYLPHIYNPDLAMKNPTRFKADAKRVYDILFDREIMQNDDAESQMKDINSVINGLRNATDAVPTGDRAPAPRLSESDEGVIKRFRDANKKLKALERRQAKSDDPNKYLDQIQEQAETVQEAQAEMLEMLSERWSEYSAEKWFNRMGVGEINDFGSIGPTANFLKGRTLPNEAGAIMKEFMHENPVDLMTGYSLQAARRAEYAKIFGAENEKLKNMLEAAASAGASKIDIDTMKMGVNAATGRMMPAGTGWQNVKTSTFVFGNLSLLPMATFSSIAEPMTAGLRTGQVRDSLNAVGQTVINLVRKNRRGELMELGRTIGLILPYAQDSLMQNRLGMDVLSNRSGLQRLAGKFFVLNGLTPLTHYQRAMQLPVANAFMLRLLRSDVQGRRGIYGRVRDKIDGKEGAYADKELNELGIAKQHRKELLDWLDSLDGAMPTAEDLFGPDGQEMHRAGDLWSRATYRFATETIQDPLKTDRTFMANHPDYSAMYGIMSFIDGFTRNVIWRNLERGINDTDGKTGATAKMAVNATMMTLPMGALIAGQVLVGIVREAINNADRMQALDEDEDEDLVEWLIERGLFRSGVFGRLDPLMNMVHGVRYNTDIASMHAGPYLGHFARQSQIIIAANQGRNATTTNTAEFNAVAAAYRLAVQPAVTAGLSSISYGRASIWAGRYALLEMANYNKANEFAEFAVGEKGARHEGDPPWWEMGGSDGTSFVTRRGIRPALEAIRGE